MDSTVAELTLGSGHEAVPRARRLVADGLSGEDAGLLADVELVVAELVTNALLHGVPPVTLRLCRADGGVRVEVEDRGREAPVPMRAGEGAMTGRGLRLVVALASCWGVRALEDGGKVVWAQLDPAGSVGELDAAAGEADIDELLAAWAEEEAGAEPLFTVHLGAVPTDLLLDAKAHIDNLVREFTLAASAAAAAGGPRLPPELAELVQTVVYGFSAARSAIRRQALDAAARGASETTLTLRLPASAAPAGERYLAALDEADRYARDARLLTLETPPAHRVFRQWYVETLVEQLRRQAAGQPEVRVQTFPERLAAEVTRLTPLQTVAEHLRLLQEVTARLTGAATREDIVTTVASYATGELGADTARVHLLDGDVLRSVATGVGRPTLGDGYDELALDAALPGAEALRTGRPVLVRDLAELTARYPHLRGVYPDERSVLVAPLIVGGHRLGVLSLTFRGQSAVEQEAQRAFLTTLADVTAQALERAAAASAAEQATTRLRFLADASVALARSVDYAEVVQDVARIVVPELADWCVIQMLDGADLRTVALTHHDREKVAWANALAGRYPTDMTATTGAPNVVRTGRSELYPVISDELLAASATDEEHLRLIRTLGMSSALIVPLAGRGGVIGALTMIQAESGRRYGTDDVAFAEDLGRRIALAVETAEEFRDQSQLLDRVIKVAEIAQHAILSPPPEQIGPVALSARYVSATAEALVGGDLYEVVERPGAVRLLIGDVRGKGVEAVRTATIVLGEFRAAAADIDDLVEVAMQIDRRLLRYLGGEDFVTALLADVADDGVLTLVSCGHPPAVLAHDGQVRELDAPLTLPVGLGATPQPVAYRLTPGDRLLLYTDGMLEAHDRQHRFVDAGPIFERLATGPFDAVADGILDALHAAVGASLGDDLALLIAEYRGS